MKSRLESRLKKLEMHCPTEPIVVTVMCYGTMPNQEEAAKAIEAARRTGVDLRFELYHASEPSEVGPESAR